MSKEFDAISQVIEEDAGDREGKVSTVGAPQPPVMGWEPQPYGSMRSVLGGINGLSWEWIEKPSSPALHGVDLVLVDRAHVARLQMDLTFMREERDILQRKVDAFDRTTSGIPALARAEQLQARFAELEGLLRSMTSGYRQAMSAAFDRITELGGDCDSVEKMLADNPDYAKAVAVLNPAEGRKS